MPLPTAVRALAALALAAALAPACARGPCDAGSGCNLLVVVVDTLRADHVGAYGYPRDTTPHLDALAARATLHTRAFATSPWTLPSHASLFTGLAPSAHGAHGWLRTDPGDNARPLGAAHRTLAEVLRDAGWETAAFVANEGYLHRWTGLDQGFDVYEVERRPGEALAARALQWLDQPRGAPFFLFVNLMDAHRPYNTAPLPPGRSLPAPDPDPALLDRLVAAVMAGAAPPELVERVVAQYDTGVAHADRALGALVSGLAERGLLDRTLVVATSDHGEYFGEHGLVEHSKDVYQPALWIPLVVKRPDRREGRRDDAPTSLAHVPALVADVLGPAVPELREAFSAASDGEVLAELHYSRTRDLVHPGWGRRFHRLRRVVYDWPWKYIASSDGDDALYELARDPEETRNRVGIEPDRAERLARRLAAALGPAPPTTPAAPPPAPSPEALEALRELGYVE